MQAGLFAQAADRSAPPPFDASSGGFTIHRLTAPPDVDGKSWRRLDLANVPGPVTVPGGGFTLTLVETPPGVDTGDFERYQVVFTAPRATRVRMEEISGFAWVTPDARWIFTEPLDVVDVRTWRRYQLSTALSIEPYISLMAVSADGRRLFLSRRDCPYDCQGGAAESEYYELRFPQ